MYNKFGVLLLLTLLLPATLSDAKSVLKEIIYNSSILINHTVAVVVVKVIRAAVPRMPHSIY